MDQQEDKYPEFLKFSNATNKLKFEPNSKKYAGKTFYFTIVVKETNSDSVSYSFYATVRVNKMNLTEEEGIAGEEVYEQKGKDKDGKTQTNYTI